MANGKKTQNQGETISMRALGNELLEVNLLKIGVDDAQVTAVIQLSYPDWRHALREGLFHLDDEQEPPDFDEELAVDLVLRLRPNVAFPWIESPDRLSSGLQDPASPLLHTEAWFATDILQESDLAHDIEGVTDLQMGAQTRWAKPIFEKEDDDGTILGRLQSFLQNEDWPYSHLDENTLRFPAGVGEGRSWVVVATTDEEMKTCTIHSVHMKTVPVAQRHDALIWLARTNYGLNQGSFDMNPDTGEIRFRSTFPAASLSQIKHGLRYNLDMMAKYLDALAPFFSE